MFISTNFSLRWLDTANLLGHSLFLKFLRILAPSLSLWVPAWCLRKWRNIIYLLFLVIVYLFIYLFIYRQGGVSENEKFHHWWRLLSVYFQGLCLFSSCNYYWHCLVHKFHHWWRLLSVYFQGLCLFSSCNYYWHCLVHNSSLMASSVRLFPRSVSV